MTDLRPCCQRAVLDGISPVRHYEVCDTRAEDPDADALFDLPDQTTQGGPQL